MNENRLANVESTLAFQEKTIEELSDVICRQQTEIDLLKAQVKDVLERMEHNEEESLSGDDFPAVEKPPHY